MSLRKNVIWNTVGTIFYLAVQWLTTVLIVRISNNYQDAGLYSLAISITNVFYIIAIYNVRNFQAADIKEEYKNEDYLFHRITVMLLALLICSAFAIVVYHDSYTVGIIVFYMVFRLNESLVDVLHGMDQRVDRMDIVGKSYLLRGIVMLISFVFMEIWTKDLLLTIIVMAITSFITILIFDVRKTNQITAIHKIVRKDKIIGLYKACFPLLTYGVALNLTASLPRIITEKMYGNELLGYYSSVATPAVIVQAFANVIFSPFITTFSRYYNEGDGKKFQNLAIKLVAFCIGLGACAYVGSLLLGRFVLEKILFQDAGIGPYCYLLNSTMICTTLVALIWLLAIILTIDRATKVLTVANVFGTIFELILAYILIDKYQLDGINISLIITYLLIIIIMGCSIIVRLRKHFYGSD